MVKLNELADNDGSHKPRMGMRMCSGIWPPSNAFIP